MVPFEKAIKLPNCNVEIKSFNTVVRKASGTGFNTFQK